jgi:hypothetical protein
MATEDKKNGFVIITYYCGVDVLNFPIYVTHRVDTRARSKFIK